MQRHLNLNFFVLLSSYRNTIINESARVFSSSYFLIDYIKIIKLSYSVVNAPRLRPRISSQAYRAS